MLRSVVSKVFNMKIKEKIAFSVYIQRKVKCLHEMKNSLISQQYLRLKDDGGWAFGLMVSTLFEMLTSYINQHV